MRYILYARKATENQDCPEASLNGQVRVLREFAQHHCLNVVAEITEIGAANKCGTRSGFNRLLTMLKTGQADTILCQDIHRLSRSIVEIAKLGRLLRHGELRHIQTLEQSYQSSGASFLVEKTTI